MTNVILPSARMGVITQLGEILSKDFKNGVSVFARDNVVVFRVIEGGRRVKEIEFGPDQTEHMAEFFKRGADLIARHGGSGLAPTRTVPPTLV